MNQVLFTDLGLSKSVVDVLTNIKFIEPTPIQAKAIPLALQGKDVIGIAQTGTGKTLAFTLPMIERIQRSRGKGLILVPTRELAHQVREEIDKIGSRIGIHSVLLVGGASIEQQVYKLRRNPQIIVATPGRIIDHLERRTVKLYDVQTLVLDEADRMLDMGFTPQINRVLETVPKDRQTLLFSATMASGVARIAESYMQTPERVEVAPSGTSAKNIAQGVYFVEQDNKFTLLKSLIDENKGQLVMVFCRTKHATKKMALTLNKEGVRTEELHSNRSLPQRRRALENFKTRRSHVLIATDVAARGIDVKEIALVVNFDIPEQLEDYVHRIGRTGRAGHSGKAVTFATPRQMRDVKSIERIVGKEIPFIESPLSLKRDSLRMSAGNGGRSGGRNAGRSYGRSGGGRPSRPFGERRSFGKARSSQGAWRGGSESGAFGRRTQGARTERTGERQGAGAYRGSDMQKTGGPRNGNGGALRHGGTSRHRGGSTAGFGQRHSQRDGKPQGAWRNKPSKRGFGSRERRERVSATNTNSERKTHR